MVLRVLILIFVGATLSCTNQELNSVQLGLREVSFSVSQEGSARGILRIIKSNQTAPFKITCPSGSAYLQARSGGSNWIDLAEIQCQGEIPVDASISVAELVAKLADEGSTVALPSILIDLRAKSSVALSKAESVRIIETSVLPEETLIALSGGASITNSSIVSLSANAAFRGDGSLTIPQSIYITSQPGCAAGGVWQPYFALIPIVPLDLLDQVNTKYVAFRDNLGNVSECLHTSILHDGTAPQLDSVLIDSGALQTESGLISVEISSTNSDLSQMAIFLTSNCSGAIQWEPFASSISLLLSSNGLQYVSARIRDTAGNVSGCVSDSIVYDTQPPDMPTALALADSIASTDNESAISVRVLGVIEGDTALLYSDASCSTLLGSAIAIGNEATISISLASDGLYTFFARARDPQNRLSTCTSTSVNYVLDRVGPSVLRVTSSLPDGDYATGSTVSVQVIFSDPVVVTGIPTLSLDFYGTTSLAVYSGGSGSATLTFEFTVTSAMTEDDLNYVSTSSLTVPNGATIIDTIGNPADLTLPDTASANALAQQKNIQINFSVYLSEAYGPASGVYGNSDNLEVTLFWSGPMSITETPTPPNLTITVGESDRGFTYQSRSYPMIGLTKFQYSSNPIDQDLNGLDLVNLSPSGFFNNIFSSPALTSIPPSLANLGGFRILNGEIPEYSFGTSDIDHLQTVSESAGQVSITVQLSSPALESTRINYVIRSATALKDSDYSGQGGFVEIMSGESSAQLTIPLINDSVAESPEVFAVDLISSDSSRPSKATSMLSKIVYVLDDDGASPRTIVDVVSGTSHLCTLDVAGSVRCVGDNTSGQLGQGNTNAYSGMVDVSLLGPAQAISAGSAQTCAIVLRDNGNSELHCWGANANGSFGLGHSTPQPSPTMVPSAGIQVAAVEHNHNSAVTVCILVYDSEVSGNAIRCAGNGSGGQLGRGSLSSSSTFIPQSPPIPSAVTQLTLGRMHGCAIANNGLYCWGNNDNNQLGLGTLDVARRLSPTLVTADTAEIVRLRAFFDTTCVQQIDSLIKCWGQAAGNAYGNGATANTGVYAGSTVNLNLASATISDFRVGRTHACVRLSDDSGRCWASGNYITSTGYLFSASPSTAESQGVPFGVQQLWPLWGTTCFVPTALGSFGCVGSNAQTSRLLFEESAFNVPRTIAPVDDPIVQIEQSPRLACYRTSTGRLRCMTPMSSLTGGMGDGTFAVARYSPVDLGATDITDFALGDFGGCYLRTDQTLWCWGQNSTGQVGDGSTINRPMPVLVLNRVLRVLAGAQHFCAQRLDYSLWCWGLNSSGQVGSGNFNNQRHPIQVLSQVTDFAVGNTFTCAIKDNQILCWGRNIDGELGDGSGVARNSPNPALDIHSGTMVDIEAGAAHACVRHSTGFVKCWGDNAAGQLGRGDQLDAYIPWQTISSGVNAMSLGATHSCFLFADQTVRCVGSGLSFQTGTNNTANQISLISAPQTLSSVTALWTGRSNSTCARQTSGTIRCWGANTGLFSPRPSPLTHIPRLFPQVQW